MAMASWVVLVAGSAQTFLWALSAQEAVTLFIDLVPAYGKHVCGELGRILAKCTKAFAKPVAGTVRCNKRNLNGHEALTVKAVIIGALSAALSAACSQAEAAPIARATHSAAN